MDSSSVRTLEAVSSCSSSVQTKPRFGPVLALLPLFAGAKGTASGKEAQMRKLLLPTIAAAMAVALPALAQESSSAATQAPSSSTATGSSAPADTGTASSTSTTAPAATLSVGQPVKDNTGAVIGQIAELKPGAGGQTATVKMGAQSFTVDAKSFAVQDGAAVINATKAELQSMIANAKGG